MRIIHGTIYRLRKSNRVSNYGMMTRHGFSGERHRRSRQSEREYRRTRSNRKAKLSLHDGRTRADSAMRELIIGTEIKISIYCDSFLCLSVCLAGTVHDEPSRRRAGKRTVFCCCVAAFGWHFQRTANEFVSRVPSPVKRKTKPRGKKRSF